MNRLFAIPLIIAAANDGVTALAQTAEGTGRAQIVQPLSVQSQTDLDFGQIAVAHDQDGSVTIDPETLMATHTGSARNLCSGQSGCATAPAVFVVSGEPERSFRMSLPSTIEAVSSLSPTARLPVDTLVAHSANAGRKGPRGVLGSDGRDTITVGGTLRVPAASSPGRYVAQMRLVVTYD